MSLAPNSGNYTLGKGKVIFNGIDLGNIPSFTLNIALEKLKHYSSRSGTKSLDKTIVTLVTPMAKFKVDEMSVKNIGMSLLGTVTKVIQATGNLVGTQASVAWNTNYEIINTADATRKFRVGTWKISHGTVTNGPYVVGETITGGTSLATGVITKVGVGYVYVNTIAVSLFVASETITSAIKVATTTTAQTWTEDLAVRVAAAYKTLGTDYTIDAKSGRIKIVSGGGIAAAATILYDGTIKAYTYSTCVGLSSTSINGNLVFVPDVPEGNDIEIKFHSVSLTPTGDLALIGEELMSIEFECEIFKDEVVHPASPYMDAYIADYE